MFIRKKHKKSGSISVQIISKSNGKYKVVKTLGSSKSEQEVEKLCFLGKQELERISIQPNYLFQKMAQLLKVFLTLYKTSISEPLARKLFSVRFLITLALEKRNLGFSKH